MNFFYLNQTPDADPPPGRGHALLCFHRIFPVTEPISCEIGFFWPLRSMINSPG
ncbi:hypothetical protein OpiT1DRAFT_03014 [Opitutaceae bacterium TAV1]|nr:hypothetical protein OPIT5_11290 [Opitutaceae bacterium TAV5]EIP98556.1 hypothetical protein OpiT1DRAFT_03014 [Opitutaceae bacterium TAV1]